MRSPKTYTTDGFTVLELLISLAIITALAGLGLFVSMDLYRSYSFRSESNRFISTLERARSRSMNNVNEMPHGIAIASAGYTLFQGPSYALRDTTHDEYTAFGSTVLITESPEILFEQLTGDSTVSMSMSLTDSIRTATVSLNYEGRISW